ncbi:hypothetical protein ACFSRY_15055 [Pontibacter locisalis]|uniref:Uncharacterized protein n=1 Tax=Pontibacter locisalis TaxID=1719035 RepID=A0ABW5IP77_9BACT
MAEINIERKKKPVWPWVLLLLLVALLAWGLYVLTNEPEEIEVEEIPETGMVVPAEAPQPLYSYVA